MMKQKRFYNNRYRVMRRALHKLQNVVVFFYDLRLVEMSLGTGSIRNVLEVGCGQGTDAILASRHARQVVATDISFNAVKVAKALSKAGYGSGNISFIVADAAYLPLRKATFDIVFCKDLLHHVADSLSAILEMRRVASDCGKVAAMEANAYNFEMILIGLIYFSVDKGVFKSTKARLIAAFEEAKLSQVSAVETEFLPRHLLFEYRSPLANLSVSRLRAILGIMRRIERKLQNVPIARRCANYILVQGVNSG